MKGSGRLAQGTRTDLGVITGEHHHQKTYQDDDISGDDDDGQPAGDDFNDGQGDERGREKKFVSDGVKISAQFSPLVSDPCNETVNSVCDPCNGKGKKGPLDRFIDDEDDEDLDQEDPCQRQDIRKVQSNEFGVRSKKVLILLRVRNSEVEPVTPHKYSQFLPCRAL